MTKRQVHIYMLSRLAFADATDWQRILRDLSLGRKSMYWSYTPVRMGAYELVRKKGADTSVIYANVAQLAEKAGGAKCRRANLNALSVFESEFLPRIGKAKRNLMEGRGIPVEFGQVQLVGGPHFTILGPVGTEAFVYLHPSRWKQAETVAFCELLTVVLEKRYEASARDLWFLDLRSGERIPWPNSRRLVRRKCERAAELLVTFIAANLEESGE